MANLVDTNVNGDLRVTGTMFGTQAGNYATCATAAATAAKAVTISGFTLATGIHVFVKFTVTNTAAVASLTLNVSGTGAKAMKYRGGNLPAVGTLSASRVYEFIYDGTNWELVGDLDTNTQTVTGVKGNAESSYRTGQVNITPANIGVSATTTSVTVGSTTASIPQATATTPKMDGTAAVGSETTWAKGDHVHPTDTSRVPTTRTVNGHALSADVTVTAADVSAVRYDTNAQGLTDTQKSNARTNIGAGTSNLTLGTTSTTAAKGDHTHTVKINGAEKTIAATGGTAVNLGTYTEFAHVSDTAVIGNNSPAADCKTYFVNNVSNGSCKVVYCKNGDEYTIIFSKQAGGAYGNIIKYGYASKYIYILRYKNSVWQSDDWEKIAAGYADSAATATSATNVALIGSVKTTSTTNGDTIQFQAGSGTAGTVTIVNAKHAASADSATNSTNSAVTADTTHQLYLIGATGSSGQQALKTDTGIYATATAGQLHATTFDVNSKCTLQFNTTTNALDFVFA